MCSLWADTWRIFAHLGRWLFTADVKLFPIVSLRVFRSVNPDRRGVPPLFGC
jgi:hypothetical protein